MGLPVTMEDAVCARGNWPPDVAKKRSLQPQISPWAKHGRRRRWRRRRHRPRHSRTRSCSCSRCRTRRSCGAGIIVIVGRSASSASPSIDMMSFCGRRNSSIVLLLVLFES